MSDHRDAKGEPPGFAQAPGPAKRLLDGAREARPGAVGR